MVYYPCLDVAILQRLGEPVDEARFLALLNQFWLEFGCRECHNIGNDLLLLDAVSLWFLLEGHLALEVHLRLHVVLSDLLCGLEAVHYRHVEVHNDYIEKLVYGLLVSLKTICGTKYVALWQPKLGEEHALQGHQGHDLIVYKQNPDIAISQLLHRARRNLFRVRAMPQLEFLKLFLLMLSVSLDIALGKGELPLKV